jgi:hypothetical protein
MATFQQLRSVIETAEADADKFFNKGNKAAGTRLRNSLQEIKKLAQELRVAVTEQKNK